MPFTSFMSPDQEGAKMAPKQKAETCHTVSKRNLIGLHPTSDGFSLHKGPSLAQVAGEGLSV